jgi:hypothetical protein
MNRKPWKTDWLTKCFKNLYMLYFMIFLKKRTVTYFVTDVYIMRGGTDVESYSDIISL